MESSPGANIRARVKELSLRGCLLEMPVALGEQQSVQVKIFCLDEYFEAPADVIYVRPTGVGLLFGDIKPHFRSVLQKWILTALDTEAKSEHP